jgi:hypothetical protein
LWTAPKSLFLASGGRARESTRSTVTIRLPYLAGILPLSIWRRVACGQCRLCFCNSVAFGVVHHLWHLFPRDGGFDSGDTLCAQLRGQALGRSRSLGLVQMFTARQLLRNDTKMKYMIGMNAFLVSRPLF